MPLRKTSTKKPTTPYYIPPYQHQPATAGQGGHAITHYKNLSDMPAEEAVEYLKQLIARLRKMQTGMQQYLDRRAARGTHTPTDDTYEANVSLVDETVSVLNGALDEIKMLVIKQDNF